LPAWHKRSIPKFIFPFQVIGLLACIAITLPAFAAVKTKDGPPQGFEELDAPRATVVTVHYGGELLGSFPAHFAPGTLQFDNAEAVVKAVPAITDKAKIIGVLSRALPAHAAMICTHGRTEDCGILSPDVAGIIFDEDHLSAELFINKKYLAVVNENGPHYLPLPGDHMPSSIYAFNGAVNGTGGAPTNFALSNNATFSSGEKRLDVQTTAANQGLRFDTIAGNMEREGWAETGGLFRSNPMQLITDRDIAGVAVATSARTRLDNYKTQGNDVIVYLPRRAFVSIYREGRLYSSHAYEAGNQQLDTTALPDGAYNITIKIQEADGSVREEQRFFAKIQNIPPPDAPIYYLQAGLIRQPAEADSTLPRLTSDPILRAGMVKRIADNLGLNTSFLGVEDRLVNETGLFWLRPTGQLQTTLLTSTSGDLGVQAGYLYNLGKLNGSFDVRQLWMSDRPMPGYEDVMQSSTQATATTSYMISPAFNLGLRASYSQTKNFPSSTVIGPYMEWRIWQNGESMLRMSGNMANTDGQNQGSILLYFSYRFGKYGVSSTGGADIGGGNGGALGSVRAWRDDSTPGNTELLGASVSDDPQRRTVSTDADLRNSFGQLRGSVQDSFGQGESTLSYGGNFSFNAAQMADEIHLGGNQTDQSAVIIDTHGDADQDMKIFVNGMERGSVKVGERQVLYLTPFHTYRIRIALAKNGLVDYDGGERKVTLYPGNVVKLAWDANKFYVVAGRIVTPDGKALAGGTLRESHTQVATDETGRVQAEISAPKNLTFATADGSGCQVHLPQNVTPTNGVLVYRDNLVCTPINQIASQ